MLAIISPAKTLDLKSRIPAIAPTQPDFLEQSAELIRLLRQLSEAEFAALMNINPKLAELNFERHQSWSLPFSEDNARPALLTFKGAVFTGFTLDEYTSRDFDFAQQNLRILSGLYGILRPLDLIQPYRLEMGTILPNSRGNDLYAFWQDRLTSSLIEAIKNTGNKTLVNLASKEYFNALDTAALEAAGIRVLTPWFKDWKDGTYKFITIYGKKARGMMVDYLIRERLDSQESLKFFNTEGYSFNKKLSQGDELVFTRKKK